MDNPLAISEILQICLKWRWTKISSLIVAIRRPHADSNPEKLWLLSNKKSIKHILSIKSTYVDALNFADSVEILQLSCLLCSCKSWWHARVCVVVDSLNMPDMLPRSWEYYVLPTTCKSKQLECYRERERECMLKAKISTVLCAFQNFSLVTRGA